MKPVSTLRTLYVFAVALFAAALLFSVSSFAQSTSGDVTGTILDASGAAVPNATVTAENAGTGIKASAVTNAAGQYRFTNLPVGSYTITATAAGFTSSSVKGLAVQLNQTLTQAPRARRPATSPRSSRFTRTQG